MRPSVKNIVHLIINAEYCDGNGGQVTGAKVVHLDTSNNLYSAVQQAKEIFNVICCADISQLKLECIDKDNPCSPVREIARTLKYHFTMKAPHAQRKWGIGITPDIKRMLIYKFNIIVETIESELHDACQHFMDIGFVSVELHRFVAHIATAAIQLLPSNKDELMQIYNQIWVKRESDKLFPLNKNQNTQQDFHQSCIQQIQEIDDDLPLASRTWLQQSYFVELQKMHWSSAILTDFHITSKAQRAAYEAYAALSKISKIRTSLDKDPINKIIIDIIKEYEVAQYWLQLLNDNLSCYQQITCFDWGYLHKIDLDKLHELVNDLESYVLIYNKPQLKTALLRLLLPLIEPWIFSVMLQRRLKEPSLRTHISDGLNELEEHIRDSNPDLIEVYQKLKQFARPYEKKENPNEA